MLNIIILALTILVAPYGIHYLWIALRGLVKGGKPNPHADPTHRFAALIPARNEEGVIAYLVDSLRKQRYPRDLYDAYVIINNCTDGTRAVAEAAGAKIIECDRPVRSKGEVLKYTFELLLKEGAPRYDAFCVFDADNLVDGGFLQAANNALSAGYQIAQGYRDSKNPRDNWVSSCTSTFFWFMSSLYNNSRHNLGMSAALNGTGIMFSRALIEQQGFDTDTLTEDLEYTALSILNGHKIGWMRDAIIYDEQPTRLMDSFTQRRRWGAGSLQCARKYLRPLWHMAVEQRNADALDIGLLFIGMYVQLVSLLPSLITVLVTAVKIIQSPAAGLWQAAWMLSGALAAGVVLGAAYALIIGILEGKLRKMAPSAYLLMWAYMLVWVPANLSCLVMRPPKWKSIAHVSAVDIGNCEAEGHAPGGAPPKPPVLGSKQTGA